MAEEAAQSFVEVVEEQLGKPMTEEGRAIVLILGSSLYQTLQEARYLVKQKII